MPFSITCPSCSVKMKTATAIAIGRSIQCPKCKKSFAVSADNMVEVGASKSEGSAPPPARKAAAAAKSSGDVAPLTGRKSNRDDDESPRARKRTADDDNDSPRGKRRPDHEDEKPRARKPMPLDDGDEDEEEERPVRKRRVDDDDDDKPRARKRRDDDDDDDIKPRKKFKKKKKKSNVGIMIALVVIGILAVGGAGYLVYSLLFGGSVDSEMMAYMPADTNYLIGIDVEELMTNEKAKAQVKKLMQSQGDKLKTRISRARALRRTTFRHLDRHEGRCKASEKQENGRSEACRCSIQKVDRREQGREKRSAA